MKNDVFKKIYVYIIGCLFILITSFLCYISYTKTCYVTIQLASEKTFFIEDDLLLNVACTIVFVLLVYLLSRCEFIKNIIHKINSDNKLFNIVQYVLLAALFIIGFVWVYGTQILPESDQHLLTNAVLNFKNGDYSAFEKGGYIEMCTNQIGIFLIYYLLSFVFSNHFLIGLQIINVISVLLTYKSLSDIAKEFRYSNFVRLLIILSAFVFPILIIYCWLIYGNIIGMAFILLSIKYELIYFKEFKIKDIIYCSIFLTIALMAKSFSLIYMIGMIIYALFKTIDIKNVKGLFMIIGIALAFLFETYVPKAYIENKTGLKLNQGASYYSYIAMGMQEGDRCEGWHNKYNQDSYRVAIYNTGVQKKIALKEIEDRLDVFKNDKEYKLKFYSRKITSQWNNPTFEVFYGMDAASNEFGYRFGDDYRISRYFEPFLNLYFETHIQEILNIEQSLMIFGCLLYMVSFFLKKNKTMEEMLLPLCFIGGFLFLIIWEAKAQYALFYYVILFLYSILGYRELIVNLNKEAISLNKRGTFIITCVCVLLIFVNGVIFNKDYLSDDNDVYVEYVACGNTYDWFNHD